MELPDDPANKAAWRQRARTARAGIDVSAWSRDTCNALRSWRPYQQATTVAVYIAFGNEADLGELLMDDKRFVAPRTARRGNRMRFHEAGGPYERHRYGMLEPQRDAPVVAATDIDLLIVPGLAFDRTGARLGYGRGFYDAWLSESGLSESGSSRAGGAVPTGRRPIVGVAHPDLLVEQLPSEAHDVSMSHLVLPNGVVACTQN